jgi:hypothetical protein
LLVSLLAACGGATSSNKQNSCPIGDPRATPGPIYEPPTFWQRGELVVGLAAKSGGGITKNLDAVVTAVHTILQNWTVPGPTPTPTIKTGGGGQNPLGGDSTPTSQSSRSNAAQATPTPIQPAEDVTVSGQEIRSFSFGNAGDGFALLTVQQNRQIPSDALFSGIVNCINASDTVNNQTPIDGNTTIIGVSPDWNMNGEPAGGGFGGGSPDGMPTLVPQASWTDNPPVGTAPGQQQSVVGQGKTVYALDTAPQQGAPSCPASTCPLLVDLLAQNDVDITSNATLDENAYICGYDPGVANQSSCNSGTAGTASIATHGLFVSALIHHLAPAARIHLRRVLNDYGVGDLQTLLDALAQIREENPNDSKDVIINMSLTLEPPAECLAKLWQGGISRTARSGVGIAQCQNGSLVNVTAQQTYTSRLFAPLGKIITDMASSYTVVAAAGNDSAAEAPSHYDADMPAAFCGVRAVAADAKPVSASAKDWTYANRSGTLADFSNNPFVTDGSGKHLCLQVDAQGKLSFGGNVDASNALVALGANVCSLYLQDSVYGEAFWGGTSFSSALVSANVASGSSPWSESQPCA